jgi:hypothetical protein
MRDRLTAHYVYYDGQHGYEALGHDAYSQRPFIEITKKLALYEDTGYTPEEVKHLKTNLLGNTADDWMGMYNVAAERAIKAEAENAKLRKVVDAAHVAVAYLQTQPTIQHILVQALADLDEEDE